MKKKTKELIDRHVVFNRRIVVFVVLTVLLLMLAGSFFKTGSTDLGITLLILAPFSFIGVFFSPLYFIFSKKDITVVWLFQYKRIILWSAIKSIIELKWGEVSRDLPKYELIYHLNYKGYIVTKQFDIPKNKETKKMIERYAKHKII